MQYPAIYTLRPASPKAHIFRIALIVGEPDAKGQRLSLPAWIPGSYMIRDFARNIVSIRASCEGEPVALSKLDKQTWQAAPVSGALAVEYDVYAWDLSVRGAHLDSTHGFFNGTSVFLQVVGQEDRPLLVNLERPGGDNSFSWKLATSLPAKSVDPQGFGSYVADSYAHLIDCPVEMGNFQELGFDVGNKPHRMVLSGHCYFDPERISRDLQKICAYHASLFGELPLNSYLFLTMVVGDGYGGLEHRDSTALLCERDDLPGKGMKQPTRGYIKFMGLCSHEYFHLWNVKRIRPQVFREADLSSEVHTELLWAFEGITSYYDDLALVRTGCIQPDDYLGLIAQTVTRVMRSSGRLRQSVAESSFDAWTRFYKQDENAPNAIISYYSKGALVAFGLDMLLRDRTGDRLSLDDFMRRLWEEYGRRDRGVSEQDLEQLASRVADADLSAFFEHTVHGTEELPLEDWFATLGVGYRLRPARNQEDWGGVAEGDDQAEAKPAIGARYTQKGDFVELLQVFDGGAAQSAGLSAGDRLIALDGLQVTAKNLNGLLGQFEAGAEVQVHAFRRDELMVFSLPVTMAPRDTCELWLLPETECTPGQLARRRDWLSQQ
ncbi:MAG TPA: M61 family peptidase [Thiolapillus brandeum]|uniref:M61 family peptidase n=1 Tax=Thiolapillus brandeum TaxID=1076588 RepID=A0A831RXL5_9GAMM|nr:M61 family peptidase [Thiolapillus brandeum]